jgi:hypothetical protein
MQFKNLLHPPCMQQFRLMQQRERHIPAAPHNLAEVKFVSGTALQPKPLEISSKVPLSAFANAEKTRNSVAKRALKVVPPA